MDNKRIEKLTAVLQRLNSEGVSDELRKEALNIVSSIDPLELSIAEQKLIENGMAPHNLRHLCEIHMEVLKDELEKVKVGIGTGHVIDTFIAEHDRVLEFLTQLERINFDIQKLDSAEDNFFLISELSAVVENILDAENHHRREENVLFPEMEKRGTTGTPRIMRMEHDDLRVRKRHLKETAASAGDMDFSEFKQKIDEDAKYIVFNLRDHIYKENHILYPSALDSIQGEEMWEDMKNTCDAIGYCGFTTGRNIETEKYAATVDVRIYPPWEKHPRIFDTFEKV